MRGGLRAGSYVRSGPSGSPPAGLRAWETGSAAPGALVRPAGSLYFDRVAGKGWISTGLVSWPWLDCYYLGAALGVNYAAIMLGAGAHKSVALGVDPSVAGLAAPVGTICLESGGAKAWLKYGAGNYDWRSLNETRASTTVAGGALADVDVSFAAPATQAFRVRIDVVSAAPARSYISLRANGAALVGPGGSALRLPWLETLGYWPLGAILNTAGSTVVLEVEKAIGLYRGVRGYLLDTAEGAYCGWTAGSIKVGAVTSLGVHAAGNYFADGTLVQAFTSPDGWRI